jgi:uncharacterized protein (DUF1330 family)
MTVYAIALLNILDRERYGTYQQGVMEIFCIAASCWPWTRRRPSRRRLALHPHCSNLIEFPADEAFDAWFNSQEYQALAEHRHAASTGSIAVIKKSTPREG